MLEEFDAQILNGQLIPAEPLRMFEGQRVHVTLSAPVQEAPSPIEAPTPEIAEQVMLEPWVWFPDAPGGRIVRATPGPIILPDPPVIPQEEDLP